MVSVLHLSSEHDGCDAAAAAAPGDPPFERVHDVRGGAYAGKVALTVKRLVANVVNRLASARTAIAYALNRHVSLTVRFRR